jgi:hypothetical protein
VLVPVGPRLEHEDHLVHAGRLVALTELLHLGRRADRPAHRAQALLQQLHPERGVVRRDDLAREALLRAVALELLPDVRPPRHVLAEHVVVRERVAEEVGAVDPALDRGGLVLVQHHREHDREVRVQVEPRRHALVRVDQRVVVVHPLLRGLRLDEREGQRADAAPGGEQDRLSPAARDPQRRVGPLLGLRHHVARRDADVVAVHAGERLLDEHAGHRIDRLLPLRPLGLAVHPEPAELHLRAGLAGA